MILITFGCKPKKKETPNLFFEEAALTYHPAITHLDKKEDFFNQLINIKYFSFQKDYKWLRERKNIVELHQILKKIGYKNLVSDSVYNSKTFTDPIDDWYNLSSRDVLDSLIHYKANGKINRDNYYTKFWKRRVSEGNEKEVFIVIAEIQKIYGGGSGQANHEAIKDETLHNLINLNYQFIADKNVKTANTYINCLKEKGLHQSAYNLTLLHPEIKINKDSLCRQLQKANAQKFGNWVVYIKDNGP